MKNNPFMKKSVVPIVDAMEEQFKAVEICGIPGIFTTGQISSVTIPRGLHAYEIQFLGNDWKQELFSGQDVTLERFGTVITASPVELFTDGHRDLFPGEFVWLQNNGYVTIVDFAERNGIDVLHPLMSPGG